MRLSPRSLFVALALLSTGAAATTASAQQVLHVPFKFRAEGKTLPAGDYIVTRGESSNFVKLASRDNAYTYNFVLQPGEENHRGVAVHFDQVGTTFVLSNIQVNDKITGKLDANSAGETNEARGQ